MSEQAIRQLCDQIADHLFTPGFGQEKADRLVLLSKDKKDMGGWSESAVSKIIERYIRPHLSQKTKKASRP